MAYIIFNTRLNRPIAMVHADPDGVVSGVDERILPCAESDDVDDVSHWQEVASQPVVPPSPEVLLEKAQTSAMQQVNALFDRCQSEGFVLSSLGFRADATRRSIEDITGLIALVQAGAITPPVTFRDYDDAYHSLTLEQLQTLCVEVTARGPQVYARKWHLEAAIAAAETVETVQAVDVTTGWPGLDAA